MGHHGVETPGEFFQHQRLHLEHADSVERDVHVSLYRLVVYSNGLLKFHRYRLTRIRHQVIHPSLHGLYVETVGAQETVEVPNGERRRDDVQTEHELILDDALNENGAQGARLDFVQGSDALFSFSFQHLLVQHDRRIYF